MLFVSISIESGKIYVEKHDMEHGLINCVHKMNLMFNVLNVTFKLNLLSFLSDKWHGIIWDDKVLISLHRIRRDWDRNK